MLKNVLCKKKKLLLATKNSSSDHENGRYWKIIFHSDIFKPLWLHLFYLGFQINHRAITDIPPQPALSYSSHLKTIIWGSSFQIRASTNVNSMINTLAFSVWERAFAMQWNNNKKLVNIRKTNKLKISRNYYFITDCYHAWLFPFRCIPNHLNIIIPHIHICNQTSSSFTLYLANKARTWQLTQTSC